MYHHLPCRPGQVAQAPDFRDQVFGLECTSAARTNSRCPIPAIVHALVCPAYASAPSLPSVFLLACCPVHISGATLALAHMHDLLLGTWVRAAAATGRFRMHPKATSTSSLSRAASGQRVGSIPALHHRRRFLQDFSIAGRGGLRGCSSFLAGASEQRAALRGATAGREPPAAFGARPVLPIWPRAQPRARIRCEAGQCRRGQLWGYAR